jgi:hypothetical protein
MPLAQIPKGLSNGLFLPFFFRFNEAALWLESLGLAIYCLGAYAKRRPGKLPKLPL